MRKTIAAVTAAGALTAAALLTPSVGYANPIDLPRAICDTYGAEHQGLVLSNLARPIATRMVVESGISLIDASTVIDSTVTNRCPEYIYLLPRP